MNWGDEAHVSCVKIDLLSCLHGERVRSTSPILIDHLTAEFRNRPDEKLENLIDEMVEEHDAIEYHSHHQDLVYLTSSDAYEEYFEELQNRCEWYAD